MNHGSPKSHQVRQEPAGHTRELADVGRLAIEELAARKERAQARTHLANLRRNYSDITGEYFDPKDHAGDDDDLALVAAMDRRAAANKALRVATSRLRAAIARAQKDQP